MSRAPTLLQASDGQGAENVRDAFGLLLREAGERLKSALQGDSGEFVERVMRELKHPSDERLDALKKKATPAEQRSFLWLCVLTAAAKPDPARGSMRDARFAETAKGMLCKILYGLAPPIVSSFDLRGQEEEIVQDVVIRMVQSSTKFYESDSPEAYFKTSMRNACISRLRTQKRHEHAANRLLHEQPSATEATDLDKSRQLQKIAELKRNLPKLLKEWTDLHVTLFVLWIALEMAGAPANGLSLEAAHVLRSKPAAIRQNQSRIRESLNIPCDVTRHGTSMMSFGLMVEASVVNVAREFDAVYRARIVREWGNLLNAIVGHVEQRRRIRQLVYEEIPRILKATAGAANEAMNTMLQGAASEALKRLREELNSPQYEDARSALYTKCHAYPRSSITIVEPAHGS